MANNIGHFLQRKRKNASLSFREASAISHQVSLALANKNYFAAAGSLSDYETMNTPPRHIEKIISLCIVYGIRFSEFMKRVSADFDQFGRDPMSDALVARDVSIVRAKRSVEPTDNGFLANFIRQIGQVPFFLRESLGNLAGLSSLSLNDAFYTGLEHPFQHPLFSNGIAVLVNRHKKKLNYFQSRPWWRQPVYLLLKRDGSYLTSCCGVEGNLVVVHEFSQNRWHKTILGRLDDIDVIGQI